MKKEVLRIEYVSKSNNYNKVLQNISINLFQGEIVKLVGKISDGAEALLRILSGNSTPDEGNIFVDGRKANLFSPKAAQKSGIGIVNNEQCFLPNFTVMESLSLGIKHSVKKFFINDKHYINRIDEVLNLLDINASPNTLLGDLDADMIPLINIGNIIMKAPKILVVDQLQNLMNKLQVMQYEKILTTLSKRNIAVLILTCDLDIFSYIAERVYVLHEGCIVGNIKKEMYDRHRILQAIEPENAISSN
jgi:ABC-type sugar transport system ATPase subunit